MGLTPAAAGAAFDDHGRVGGYLEREEDETPLAFVWTPGSNGNRPT